jgi:hypothetical protein
LAFRDLAEVRRYLELRRDMTETELVSINIPMFELHCRGMVLAFSEAINAIDRFLFEIDMRERRDEPVTPEDAPF